MTEKTDSLAVVLPQEVEQLAEKKAAAAPDKDKLLALANNLNNLVLPEMKSEEGILTMVRVDHMVKDIVNFINSRIETL